MTSGLTIQHGVVSLTHAIQPLHIQYIFCTDLWFIACAALPAQGKAADGDGLREKAG
jgi:hypothetical protein